MLTAPAKPTTTIRTDGGWWAAAAVRSGRGGGRCSNAPSLIGDLDGTAAAAYATDGRSSLLGGYYYCGGVGGRSGRVLEQGAWEVRFFTGFFGLFCCNSYVNRSIKLCMYVDSTKFDLTP